MKLLTFSLVTSIPASNLSVIVSDMQIQNWSLLLSICSTVDSGPIGVHTTGSSMATGAHIVCASPTRLLPLRVVLSLTPSTADSISDNAKLTYTYICDNMLGGYTQQVCPDIRRLNHIVNILLLCTQDKKALLFCSNGLLYSSWQGDYSIRLKALGAAGLFVGRYITCLLQGKFCSITVSAIDNSCNAVVCKYTVATPMTLLGVVSGLKFSLSTPSPLLALGISSPIHIEQKEAPLPNNAKNTVSLLLLPKDSSGKTLPLYALMPDYRIQLLLGEALLGKQINIILPAQYDKQFLKQLVVYRLNLTYNGTKLVRSRNTIRSAVVPLLLAISYANDNTTILNSQLELLRTTTEKLTLDITLLILGLAAQANKALLALLLLYDFTEHRKAYAKFRADNRHLGYQKARVELSITDPHSKLNVLLSKILSFITQLKDGSIIIRDGSGSLIRMIDGDIIISSARDVKLRPGRGLLQVVPGTSVLTANTIVSTARKLMHLDSGNNMYLLSGLTKGTLFIESRTGSICSHAKKRITTLALLILGYASNYVIRSSYTAFTSNDILVDSKSSFMLLSDTACVQLSGSDMRCYAHSISTSCGIHMQSFAKPPKITYKTVTDTGEVVLRSKYLATSTALNLTVGGGILCNSIVSYGNIAAAGGIAASRLACINASVGRTALNKAPVTPSQDFAKMKLLIAISCPGYKLLVLPEATTYSTLPLVYTLIGAYTVCGLFAWQRLLANITSASLVTKRYDELKNDGYTLTPLLYTEGDKTFMLYPGLRYWKQNAKLYVACRLSALSGKFKCVQLAPTSYIINIK